MWFAGWMATASFRTPVKSSHIIIVIIIIIIIISHKIIDYRSTATKPRVVYVLTTLPHTTMKLIIIRRRYM